MTNPYHNSICKKAIDITFAGLGMIFLLPVFLIISLLLIVIDYGPIFFVQERAGKNGKPFKMIKFRTMIKEAQSRQKGLKNKNEADGPVFKIYNDPRFTKFGKILAHTGLDELPQFINILKGEMSIVGPRPLPVSEANNVAKIYKKRESVKPGATSSWVVMGSHKLPFKKWMELDLEYIKKATITTDLSIIVGTIEIIFRALLSKRS